MKVEHFLYSNSADTDNLRLFYIVESIIYNREKSIRPLHKNNVKHTTPKNNHRPVEFYRKINMR